LVLNFSCFLNFFLFAWPYLLDRIVNKGPPTLKLRPSVGVRGSDEPLFVGIEMDVQVVSELFVPDEPAATGAALVLNFVKELRDGIRGQSLEGIRVIKSWAILHHVPVEVLLSLRRVEQRPKEGGSRVRGKEVLLHHSRGLRWGLHVHLPLHLTALHLHLPWHLLLRRHEMTLWSHLVLRRVLLHVRGLDVLDHAIWASVVEP
jgi:hypothetical protein